MQATIYSGTIKTRNLDGFFNIFRKELEKFLLDESEIYKDWMNTDEEKDYRKCNRLRMLYCQRWSTFTKSVPLTLQTKCSDENGKPFRLSDLTNGGSADGMDEELNERLIEQLVRYSIYIHLQKNILYPELIIWQSLVLVEKMMVEGIMAIRIHPDNVVSVVKRVLKEVDKGTFTKPQASFWKGKLYDHRLSSSKKTYIYRQKTIDEWADKFVISYIDKHHKLPNKHTVYNHIIGCCVRSDEPRLHLFSDGMNLKTFRKYTKQFRMSNTRRKQ